MIVVEGARERYAAELIRHVRLHLNVQALTRRQRALVQLPSHTKQSNQDVSFNTRME